MKPMDEVREHRAAAAPPVWAFFRAVLGGLALFAVLTFCAEALPGGWALLGLPVIPGLATALTAGLYHWDRARRFDDGFGAGLIVIGAGAAGCGWLPTLGLGGLLILFFIALVPALIGAIGGTVWAWRRHAT